MGPDCFIVFPIGVMIISLNFKAIYEKKAVNS